MVNAYTINALRHKVAFCRERLAAVTQLEAKIRECTAGRAAFLLLSGIRGTENSDSEDSDTEEAWVTINVQLGAEVEAEKPSPAVRVS